VSTAGRAHTAVGFASGVALYPSSLHSRHVFQRFEQGRYLSYNQGDWCAALALCDGVVLVLWQLLEGGGSKPTRQ